MSNFQLVRYKATDTWIPPDDIDGVDANETVLADITNIDFSNGYLENASNTTGVTLPSNVTVEIANGYGLLSAKTFYHSVKGQQTVYILWKEATSDLKIYCNNDLLNIDERGNGIIYLAKPEKISYNLVNDQLKINLNIKANYITVEPVILNLTLVYLPEVRYTLPTVTFSAITFVGTGTNSITVAGTENNGVAKSYEIRVTTVHSQPDPFDVLCSIGYSVDGVDSGETFNITTAGATLTLWTGVQVTFPGTTGYALGDKWTFSTISDAIQRPEGWYITPRWLGWAQKCNLVGSLTAENIIEDFGDGVINDSRITIGGDAVMSTVPTGVNLVNNGSYINILNLESPNEIIVSGYTPESVTGLYTSAPQTLEINIYDSSGVLIQTSEIIIMPALFFMAGNIPSYSVKVKDRAKSRYVTISKNTSTSKDCYITNITVKQGVVAGEEGYVIIGLTQDGQRSLMQSDDAHVALTNNRATLQIKIEEIDWRYSKYELYRYDGSAYILVREYFVSVLEYSGLEYTLWTKNGIYVESDGMEFIGESTLNFKYNLPFDARVDNQRYIYSEITHKGRVYFVNNDYKIYQSHISTNLAIQADAFPYDEETGFGYVIVDHSKVNLALANSPTNDMVVITNQGLYVYFIQPSGSGSFKQLRIGSGSVTISSLKTLTSLLNGEPATDGLFWIDYNGIYYYVGGTEAPENLITLTHKRYWESFSNANKEQAVGFYNPNRKEYWLSIGGKVLIFELSFKKFKKYGIAATMPVYADLAIPTDFVGYVGLTPYYTSYNRLISCVSSNRLPSIIETHYNSVEGQPEINSKILQELYLELGESDNDATIYMFVYADDWLVSVYIFNGNKKLDKRLSPVGVRFNRLKLRIMASYGKHIKIKEFGFSYSPDFAEPLGIEPVNIAESGYGFDYGHIT